jgi:DNA repair protein RecO (recombination protein O)
LPTRWSESITIRTYPFREADLIVSFLTRDQGKLRGVARRARRAKSPFGSGLERLSHVKMFYLQRENRELVNLDSCELIHSQFSVLSEYGAAVALDYFAEISENLLPEHEPSERFFRLLLAVLEFLRAAPATAIWPAATYFALWAVRLTGVLPPQLPLSMESRVIAEEMLSSHIGQLPPRDWTKATAVELRRFLLRRIEEHAERRLITAPILEAL